VTCEKRIIGSLEGLLEVGDEVADVLEPDAEAEEAVGDADPGALLGGERDGEAGEQLLAAGAPLTVEHLDDAFRMMRAVENDLIKHSVAEVKDAVLVEQILIEMDEMLEAA